jgi:hypothetical protein
MSYSPRANKEISEGMMTVKTPPPARKSVKHVEVRKGRRLTLTVNVSSPVTKVPRSKLKPSVELTLVARSAGRCEFRGCNKFLYTHPLTGDAGNFAENAHIVAFRERGPRGADGERPTNIDAIENLMLLCAPCHHLIDTNCQKYPRAELETHKREHESRIKRVTALGPTMQTTVLHLKARIGSNVVEVSQSESAHALLPRYPAGDSKIIDLTGLGDEASAAFYDFASGRIRDEAKKLYATGGELETSKHLSVLALAPIPLLFVLGNSLSNKVQTDFFQCHRDRADRWTWHEGKSAVTYAVSRRRVGTVPDNVAVLVSLSGTIATTTLPASIDDSFSIYEITLDGLLPNPGFLQQRNDLEGFRQTYRKFLAEVTRDHPEARALHVFPAIPAPVAVVCGFDLLPKVHPELLVYDNDKQHGGFVQRLKVNAHVQQ